MSVITTRFGNKEKAASAATGVYCVERLNAEQRRAFGLLTQIYGTLVGAGLYVDSTRYGNPQIPGMIGLQLRRRNSPEHAPWVPMTVTYNDRNERWEFRYRSVYAEGGKLEALMQEAHRAIAALERRALRPLMAGIEAPQTRRSALRAL